MKRALIAAGLLLGAGLLAAPAQAQTGTARGKVVDAEGQPIPEVKVLIEFQGGITRKFETKTNKKGEYMQVGMQPGPYRITASKEGFQPAVSDVRISLGDPTAIPDFKLATMAQASAQPGSSAAELRSSFQKAVELQSAGQLSVWQYASQKDKDGALKMMPLRRIVIFASGTARIEPYKSAVPVLPPS